MGRNDRSSFLAVSASLCPVVARTPPPWAVALKGLCVTAEGTRGQPSAGFLLRLCNGLSGSQKRLQIRLRILLAVHTTLYPGRHGSSEILLSEGCKNINL